jgi:APA family basic amino acid/polyamine antiporter
VSTPSDRKPLGFFSLLTLGINGTIGVGIFFAPKEVAANTPGYTGAWVYVLAGAALLPVAFVYSRLGRRFAEDGGPYVWARLAFGPRIAFLIGFLTYVSAVLSTATVATGLSKHIASALGPDAWIGQKGLAVLGTLAMASAAASGLRLSALAWNSVTVLKLLPLFMLTLLAAYAVFTGSAAPSGDVVGSEVSKVGRALLIVVFALQGFEIVPVLAGSSSSQRAVAWATLATLVSCMLFYGVLHWLCVRALPDLGKNTAPIVAAAKFYGGDLSARIVAAGQIISALGIAFGQTVTTPRYLSTLGRADGLGEWIGAEDVRRVPQRALWITTAGVIVFVCLKDLGDLFALSSIAVLAQYTVATLALAVLAQRGFHDVGREQRWWALPALVGISLVAQGAEAKELLTTAGVTGLGGLILLVRQRLRRTTASV